MSFVTQHNDPYGKLNISETIGFGLGVVPAKTVFQIISSFLSIYLTNVVFLDIASVSAIVGISKLLDGISDLIIGRLIHNTKSRMGKARVWLLRMCLPLALSLFLLFHVPTSWSSLMKYIYVFTLFNLTTTVFMTFMQISEYALLSLITQNKSEQSKLSSSMNIFTFASGLLNGTLFVKMLLLFTDQAGKQNTQRAYTCTVLAFCIVIVVAALISVFTTKERVVDGIGENGTDYSKEGFMTTAGKLVVDRYFLIMFAASVICSLTQQFIIGSNSYYALYILKDMGSMSWLMFFSMIAVILVQFANPSLVRRFGAKKVYIAGVILIGTCGIVIGVVTPVIPAIKLTVFLKGFGIGMRMGAFYLLVADVVRYTGKKIGINTAVLCNAGLTAGEKIGQGAGIALFGFVMSSAGFDGALTTQPQSVMSAIMIMNAWAPGIIVLVAIIVFIFIFDLDKRMADDADRKVSE